MSDFYREHLAWTVLEPDFTGVDLLIEDVSEHHYRIDRTMFHITANPNVRKVARLRLGHEAGVPARLLRSAVVAGTAVESATVTATRPASAFDHMGAQRRRPRAP